MARGSGVPEVQDLAPVALWAGFLLLLLHDVLVRLGIMSSVAKVAEVGVLAFTCLVVAHAGVSAAALDVDLGAVGTFLDSALAWPEVLSLECLPGCVARLEAAVPGCFCTAFCLVTTCRNIVGGRSHFAKGVLSAVLVVASLMGGLVAMGREDLWLQPNVTCVMAAVALAASQRAAFIPTPPGGTAAPNSNTDLKKIEFHRLIYWFGRRRRRNAGSSSGSDPDAHASDALAAGAQHAGAPAALRQRGVGQEGGQARAGAGGRGGAASALASASPSPQSMEVLWANVKSRYGQLDRAKKVHAKYKALAFKQEAIANGVRPYDGPSTARAVAERGKAELLKTKCTQAAQDVRKLDRDSEKARAEALAMESALAGADADAEHAKQQ